MHIAIHSLLSFSPSLVDPRRSFPILSIFPHGFSLTQRAMSQMENGLANCDRLMHTLVQQQSTASAEPFEVHERRIETLQANVAQYRLQSLHLELDDGALGNEGWDEQERSSWLKLCE